MKRPKKCPFCGARDPKVWTRDSYDRRFGKTTTRTTVYCQECGCRTEAHSRPCDAVRSWNRRAADDPVPQPGLSPWQKVKFAWGLLWT